MAKSMHDNKGIEIDWLDRESQSLLLSYLYQHLVHYTELNLRYAVRLDHWTSDDGEDEQHPLLNKLVADSASDPLIALSAREEALKEKISEPDCHYSLASAYVHLLRHFDNKMSTVANHLLISLSYCYRRYTKVCMLAEKQHPIPIHQTASHHVFLPGAWRQFRLRRVPLQLALDFGIDQSPTLYFGRPQS